MFGPIDCAIRAQTVRITLEILKSQDTRQFQAKIRISNSELVSWCAN